MNRMWVSTEAKKLKQRMNKINFHPFLDKKLLNCYKVKFFKKESQQTLLNGLTEKSENIYRVLLIKRREPGYQLISKVWYISF